MAIKTVEPEVQRWLTTISQYEAEFKDWERRSKRVIDRYLDRKSHQRKAAKFNVLWSNVQTLVPACFSRIPKASVSRRFKDNDPVGRVASLLLERALQFEIEHYADYRQSLTSCVQDRFLGGRGTTWVRYEPHTRDAGPDDGLQVTEDTDEAPGEVLEYECTPVDYVHWRDFGHSVARTWEEVTAVWRKVYMTKAAVTERFGEEWADKVAYDVKPEDLKRFGNSDGGPVDTSMALVYEIWDKASGEAMWLSKSLGEFLDKRPDPLGLQDFWPCPKPLYGTLTSDSLVPTPDLVFYQDQADACDTLAERITGLITAMQVKGVYDAAVPELRRLFTEGMNNDLIPVNNWAAFAEKQGLKGAIDIVDLTPIFNALTAAYQAFKEQISQIYQITGIADIIRGDTDARETLGAQELKGQFATLRIRDSQKDVAYFATDILRIKAQLICGKFQPETIAELGAADQLSEADQMLLPQAMALLKSANARTFRIEVEADSLVALDENMEKQQRMEFLAAVSGYMEKVVQAVQVAPQAAPLMAQMLKFGVTGFKVGKTLEGAIDQAIDQLQEGAKNPPPKPPDPEQIKGQVAMAIEDKRAQTKAQEAQIGAQTAVQTRQLELQFEDQKEQRQAERDMQVEQWKQQMQAAEAERTQALEMQKHELEISHTAALEEQRRVHEAEKLQMQLEFDRWKVIQDNETKIVVAQIAAGAKAEAAEGAEGEEAKEPAEPEGPDMGEVIAQAIEGLKEAFANRRPYEVIRGPDGRAVRLQ